MLRGATSSPSQPLGSVSSVVLEVWDSASEGDPVMLGTSELPSDLLRGLLSSSRDNHHRDSKKSTDDGDNDDDDDDDGYDDDGDDDGGDGDRKRKAGRPEVRSRRLRLLNLPLGFPPPKRQSFFSSARKHKDGYDEERRAPSAATKGAPTTSSAPSGTLSVSLERVSPEKTAVLASTSAKRVTDTDTKSAGGKGQDQERVTILPDGDTNHALLEAKHEDVFKNGMGGTTTGAKLSEVCIYVTQEEKGARSALSFVFFVT